MFNSNNNNSGNNTPSFSSGGGAGGEKKENAPAFSFGNNSNTFGASTNDKPNPFGQSTTQPAITSSGGFAGFGGATATAPASGSLFGAKTDTSNNASTTPAGKPTQLFGGGSETPKNLFGGGNNDKSSTPAFGGFGTNTNTNSGGTSGGLFGNNANNTNTETKPASSGLFGGAANTGASESKPAFSLGGSSTPAASTGGGLFGGGTPSSSGGLFGGNKPATTTQAPAATTQAPATTTQAPTTGGLFGGTTAPPAPTSGLFGGTTEKKEEAKPAASTGGFNFGAPAAKTDENKPANGGLFGNTASTEKKEEAKPAAISGGFGFGGTTEKKDEAKPATAGGFSFGGATEKKEEVKPAAGGFSFGEKKEEAKPATAAPAGGLFGAAPSTEKKEENKPAGGFNLGGAGEKKEDSKTAAANLKEIAPSAYLKNKSFEDIIAKWTTALAKNSSDFNSQAVEIGSWDRVLVENGDKIGELFNQVVLAEQNQGKIDQMLQYIGRQQDDLEGLLDGYEKQASEFLTHLSGPDGLQPVDQEREKAYRLAEDLNEKLENMGGNLTSVIDEINKVSNDLNHAKEDDALTQIVKILNSHLSSLQWIDTNTTNLQEKLEQIHQLENNTRDHVDSSFNRYR